MIITLKCIATVLEERVGKRFSAAVIATKLGGHPTNILHMLNELVVMGRIRRDDSSRTKMYFMPTAADIEAEQRLRFPVTISKPYEQSGPAWARVAERLGEFRAAPSVFGSKS